MKVQAISSARVWAMSFVTFVLLWGLLNGRLTADTLLVGVLASFVITLLFREGYAPISEFRAAPGAVAAVVPYLLFFFKELVKSNLRLARIVLSPALPLNPGIVKVRTRLKSRMGRLLLANSITLTPGTLTVELTGEWLYIHWVTMESADIDEATASIVAGFERYIEVMYG